MKSQDLQQLIELAQIREQKSGAKLARLQTLIDQLEGKATALRTATPNANGDIGAAIMQDRWHRWRNQQIAVLNTQVARLQAVAQPERERHARNVAKRNVIETLRARSKAEARRRDRL